MATHINYSVQPNMYISDKMIKNMPSNLEGRNRTLKRIRNCAICAIPLLIICVPMSLILFSSLPLMFTMLALFASCMPILFITMLKSVQYSAVIRLRDQILLFDKINVEELSSHNFRTVDVVQLVTQMISSGNLQGYQLIDNKILVKDGVSYVEEAKSSKSTDSDTSYEGGYAGLLQDIVYCKNCGNKMTKNDKFCSKCGTSIA